MSTLSDALATIRSVESHNNYQLQNLAASPAARATTIQIILGIVFVITASIKIADAQEHQLRHVEPYDVKVDPPICEITVVKDVRPSACNKRTRHYEWNKDFGCGNPKDGDAWGVMELVQAVSPTKTVNSKAANMPMSPQWRIQKSEIELSCVW